MLWLGHSDSKEPKMKWTEVKYARPYEIVDLNWVAHEYLWLTDYKGGLHLSRDQGATFVQVGSLRYYLIEAGRKIRGWLQAGRKKIGLWLRELRTAAAGRT